MINQIMQFIAIFWGIVIGGAIYDSLCSKVAAWIVTLRKWLPADTSSPSAVTLRKPSFEILAEQIPSANGNGWHGAPKEAARR